MSILELMKIFKKSEYKIVGFSFLLLFVLTAFNINVSLRRGRDNQRKNDLSTLQKALDIYQAKYGIFPLSTDEGLIIGCFSEDVEIDPKTNRPINANSCFWGQSSFENISLMPRDPKSKDGAEYRYFSDGEHYGLYISLEGKDEPEYSEAILEKDLQCGNKMCNYGREY